MRKVQLGLALWTLATSACGSARLEDINETRPDDAADASSGGAQSADTDAAARGGGAGGRAGETGSSGGTPEAGPLDPQGSGGRQGGGGSLGGGGVIESGDGGAVPDNDAGACFANSDCAGQPCDTSNGSCVDCLISAHCDSGEVCSGSVCQGAETCTTSLDCGAGQVCAPASMVCVECLSDVDCGDEQICRVNRCVPTCQSDKECTPLGLLCDTVTGTCSAAAPPLCERPVGVLFLVDGGGSRASSEYFESVGGAIQTLAESAIARRMSVALDIVPRPAAMVSCVLADNEPLSLSFTEDIAAVSEATAVVIALSPGVRSEVYTALKRVAAVLPSDSPERMALVVITTKAAGIEDGCGADFSDMLAAAADLTGRMPSVPTYVVATQGGDPQAASLEPLAQAGGTGQVIRTTELVPTFEADLVSAIQPVLDELEVCP